MKVGGFSGLPQEKLAWVGTWLVILGWFVLSLFFWNRMPIKIPMYYSLAWGEERLVSLSTQYLIGAFILVLYIGNTWMGVNIAKTDKFLGKLFIWSGTLVVWLVLITITRIWMMFLQF